MTCLAPSAQPVAVVPLKAVAAAKSRLSAVLGEEARVSLVERLFRRVASVITVTPGIGYGVGIVGCEVGARWAREAGLEVWRDPGKDLNAALTMADRRLGSTPSVVLPGDLPLITSQDLGSVLNAGARLKSPPRDGRHVVIVPTHDGGTGALLRRPGGVIPPSYGPNSAARHRHAALDLKIAVTVLELPGIAFDLDRPDDLAHAVDHDPDLLTNTGGAVQP